MVNVKIVIIINDIMKNVDASQCGKSHPDSGNTALIQESIPGKELIIQVKAGSMNGLAFDQTHLALEL